MYHLMKYGFWQPILFFISVMQLLSDAVSPKIFEYIDMVELFPSDLI